MSYDAVPFVGDSRLTVHQASRLAYRRRRSSPTGHISTTGCVHPRHRGTAVLICGLHRHTGCGTRTRPKQLPVSFSPHHRTKKLTSESVPPKKPVPVGAIVGGAFSASSSNVSSSLMEPFWTGVIGGLALVAILIGGYVIIRRRRAAARRPVAGSEIASLPPSSPTTTSITPEPSVHQRLYVRSPRDIRVARF